MKLVRYDYPTLFNGVDDWFENPSWGMGDFAQLFQRMGRGAAPVAGSHQLAVDVYEDDEHYFVQVELPGVKRENLRVELEGEVLSISSEAKSEDGSRPAKRAIRLPDGVDAEKISAKFEDGVLTVSAGKAEAIKAKVIDVA